MRDLGSSPCGTPSSQKHLLCFVHIVTFLHLWLSSCLFVLIFFERHIWPLEDGPIFSFSYPLQRLGLGTVGLSWQVLQFGSATNMFDK
jgi:hypothetical protein